MRLLQQLHIQIHISRGTCPQGGPCLITGRLAGVKLLPALCTISRANCAAKIININPATYSDGVACFISMAKSWHTYLLLFTYLSGNSPTHTHTHSNSIKIVLVASVDIKIWARGLLASITQQQQHKNYCEMQQQQFDWHEKTSGWNWLCHAIYVCLCYMGEYVSREAALGSLRV